MPYRGVSGAAGVLAALYGGEALRGPKAGAGGLEAGRPWPCEHEAREESGGSGAAAVDLHGDFLLQAVLVAALGSAKSSGIDLQERSVQIKLDFGLEGVNDDIVVVMPQLKGVRAALSD